MQNRTGSGEIQHEGEAGLQDQGVVRLVESPAVGAADDMDLIGKALRGHRAFVDRDFDAWLATEFLEVSADGLLVG